jgi:hypothetical protein
LFLASLLDKGNASLLAIGDHRNLHLGFWLVNSDGLIWLLVLWGLGAAGVVWIVWEIKRELSEGRSAPDREDQLELLRRRLEEDEISVEEYERQRKLL